MKRNWATSRVLGCRGTPGGSSRTGAGLHNHLEVRVKLVRRVILGISVEPSSGVGRITKITRLSKNHRPFLDKKTIFQVAPNHKQRAVMKHLILLCTWNALLEDIGVGLRRGVIYTNCDFAVPLLATLHFTPPMKNPDRRYW